MNTWLFVFLICLTTPCVYLFCLSLNMLGVPLYYPIPIMGSLFQIFSHIDYFLLGAFLALIPHSRLLNLFSHWKGMAILEVVLILGGLGYFFQDKLPEVLYTYSLRLVVIALCLTILVSGSRVLNSRKHWLKSISDASYTIYLFHHVLVIILLVLLNYLALTHAIVFEPNIAFAFVLLATFSITLGLHFFVIKPNKITKLLFNGKI